MMGDMAMNYKTHEFDVLSIREDELVDVAVSIVQELVVDESNHGGPGEKTGLGTRLKKEDLKCFISCAKAEYGRPPFHNFYHAVSVMQVVAVLVHGTDLFTKEEKLLLCLTALCHDAGHLGLTNHYLAQHCSSTTCKQNNNNNNNNINEEEAKQPDCKKAKMEQQPIQNPFGVEIVSKYGKLSPMEKHHVMVTLRLFRSHRKMLQCIMGSDELLMDAEQNKWISCMILHVILCTDLAVHGILMKELGLISEHEQTMKKKMKAAALIMHAADLSNATRKFQSAFEWATLLDEEKRVLEGSENASGSMIDLAKGEIGFCDAFVIPSWKSLLKVLDEDKVKPWLDNISENCQNWKRIIENTKSMPKRSTSCTSSTSSQQQQQQQQQKEDENSDGITTKDKKKCQCPDENESFPLKLFYTNSFILKNTSTKICNDVLSTYSTY